VKVSVNAPGPRTALLALSRPQPYTASTPGWPRSVAVVRMVCCTLLALLHGNACHTIAAVPVTAGAASEVPEARPLNWVPSTPGTATRPGATRHQEAALPQALL